MPIRQCKNGHLTGFRNCSLCGSKQTRDVAWKAVASPDVEEVASPAAEVKPLHVSFLNQFRVWREKHRKAVQLRLRTARWGFKVHERI